MAKKLLPSQYGKILFELTKEKSSDIDSSVKAFLQFFKQEQVLSKMPYIIKSYITHAKKAEGVTSLKIASARTLSKKECDTIATYFGENVEIKTSIDKSLLGGVRLQHDNIVIDASVKSKIDSLKKQLV